MLSRKASFFLWIIYIRLFSSDLSNGIRFGNAAEISINEHINCTVTKACMPCATSEMEEIYCKSTNHKEELMCLHLHEKEYKNVTIFQECTPESKSHTIRNVLLFEILMIGVFTGSFYALRTRKQLHFTALDRKKDTYQKRSLLR